MTEVRTRLVEIGGSTSQELGAGRIVGQVLVYLYLQENECSLDTIGEDLGLSKASISIAVRQLEQLGFVRKVWKKGELDVRLLLLDSAVVKENENKS